LNGNRRCDGVGALFVGALASILPVNRDSAECELTQLKHQHGPRLLNAVIRKDRPGRSGASRTYTLRYTIRESETRTLF
jgi:hypothetical protein